MVTSTSSVDNVYKAEDIRLGTVWQNRKTKRPCIVRAEPVGAVLGKVGLEHVGGGVKTTKKVHYFLYDFELADAQTADKVLADLAQPRPPEATFADVQDGSVWRHRKTQRTCTVRSTAKGAWDDVTLEHQTGRTTTKGVNYFLGEFELVAKAAE